MHRSPFLVSLLALAFFATACAGPSSGGQNATSSEGVSRGDPTPPPGMAKAYFASGCFWCVEAIFERVRGVEEVVSGYSGGHTEFPSYRSTNTGTTGHAEAVEVLYDPEVVSFEQLVDVFFGSQDPTQVNGQGPDRGSQYRSIAFYQSPEQRAIIESKIEKLNTDVYDGKIATEVMAFETFWIAEGYHQNYKKRNPNNGYIQQVSNPRQKRFEKKFPQLLK